MVAEGMTISGTATLTNQTTHTPYTLTASGYAGSNLTFYAPSEDAPLIPAGTYDEVRKLDLGRNPEDDTSTSTPAITDNGDLYVGTYGGYDEETGNVKGTVKRVRRNLDVSTLTTIYTGNSVQCSPVVHQTTNDDFETVDYIYFTANVVAGTGYCSLYNVDTGVVTSPVVWSVPTTNYVLQGFAVGNDFLTFGNDSNNLIIVK